MSGSALVLLVIAVVIPVLKVETLFCATGCCELARGFLSPPFGGICGPK